MRSPIFRTIRTVRYQVSSIRVMWSLVYKTRLRQSGCRQQTMPIYQRGSIVLVPNILIGRFRPQKEHTKTRGMYGHGVKLETSSSPQLLTRRRRTLLKRSRPATSRTPCAYSSMTPIASERQGACSTTACSSSTSTPTREPLRSIGRSPMKTYATILPREYRLVEARPIRISISSYTRSRASWRPRSVPPQSPSK